MATRKLIPGYNERYEIDETGNIYQTNFAGTGNHRQLKTFLTNGYPSVTMVDNYGGRTTTLVHRLLVQTFIGEIPSGHHVNHKDGNKQNSVLENLEIVTAQENILHAVRELGVTTAIPRSAIIRENVETGEKVLYDSIADAARAGFMQSAISKCCLGNRMSHRGFKWMYADPGTHLKREGREQDKRKAVLRVGLGNNAETYYPSVNHVAKDGFSPSAVSKCCRGLNHQHKGYLWKFTDLRDEDKEMDRGQRAVTAFNPLTKELKTFKSIAEAARNGFEQTAIVKCCRDQQLTHRGWEWRYL